MAQGTGINYNPITGEQQEYTYYYQPQQAPDPMTEQQKLIDQAYRDLPLQQAEEAAKAAMVYQGQRGYMRDLANGLSAPEALSKWAPLMFARNLGPGAAMVRANPLPKPNYQFVPGAGGAPNRFEAPGERPVFVPRTSMPQEVADQGLIKEEIAPNIFAVRVKGSSTVHIVNAKGEELTPKEEEGFDIRKQAALINAAGKLADLDEKSLGYNVVTNAISNLRQLRQAVAPATAPVPTIPDAPASKERKVGNVYKTPKGPFKWTEKGWVAP